MFLEQEAGIGQEHALCGQSGCRRDRIFRAAACFAARLKKTGGVVAAELLAAGGFGRTRPEKRLAQPCAHHRFNHCAAAGRLSPAVEGFIKKLLHQLVDHHVSRSSIEGHHLRGPGAGGQCRQVADASQILQHAAPGGVTKQHIVEQGNQGSALPANYHIGRAKVRDHRNTALLRQHRHLADLPGAGCLAAEVPRGRGLVIDGLTVAADQIQVTGMTLQRDGQAPRNRPGPGASSGGPIPRSRWPRHSSPPVRRGAGRGEKGSRHGREVLMPELSGSPSVRSNPGKGNVDAVGGGAAHDAGHRHWGERQ